jgi:hypothetical protein
VTAVVLLLSAAAALLAIVVGVLLGLGDRIAQRPRATRLRIANAGALVAGVVLVLVVVALVLLP